jgi:diaminopimelate epimerase
MSPEMAVPFVKAAACGNDFLMIEAAAVPDDLDKSVFTQHICDRHVGVGADGVEWMYPSSSADLEIRLINADGSDAEISGNGTRCVAAYIFDTKRKENIAIETGAGLKTCAFTAESESGYEFEADMGEAVVEPELSLNIGAGVRGIPVSMGNPHYVVFVPEFMGNWQAYAAEIQHDARFTQGVNVELVVADGKHEAQARFFERGVGETQSSGTGSCACAVAAIVTGRAESPVRVHTPGGTQTVRWVEKKVFLRGSAKLVCRGEFFFNLLA